MKNKIKLKKYLICSCIVSICLLVIFFIINIYEYNTYNDNFNDKLSKIILKIKEQYPEFSENDLMNILNNKDTNKISLDKYGIDIEKDSIILENEEAYKKFLVINVFYVLTSMGIVFIIFFKYDMKKDKELKEITKYIEEINKKNYTLHIDEISEDELSILKNEIYKVTVMLKENAENSIKDKIELKKSLEDISHQIKTPLTSILVILDNLIDDEDMDKITREEFVRDIKREVVNINFLIQAILKLSKFDANTIKYSKEMRMTKEIVEEAIKNVSTLCDLRNIKIEVDEKNEAKLNCDFKWQIEAITNVLKNCIEHSKDGGKIIISYEQNNVYTKISIEDFGEGISSKDLPHVFERFYKGKNSSQDSIGIGLALSKTIIEEDNGNINVESNGSGTKFEIKYFNV